MIEFALITLVVVIALWMQWFYVPKPDGGAWEAAVRDGQTIHWLGEYIDEGTAVRAAKAYARRLDWFRSSDDVSWVVCRSEENACPSI